MKYIYKKTSLEVKNWPKDGGEYFNILAFVHDLFKANGQPIPFDVPTPVVKFTDFHYNTNNFTGDKKDENIIYIPSGVVGKKLHASLITAIVMYYGKLINQEDVASDIIGEIEVRLTLTEVALTSGAVVTGVIVAKNIFSKIF